jgi:hypothetical protein
VAHARLVAITVFGSTTEQGLSGARKLGVDVRCSIAGVARFTERSTWRVVAISWPPPSDPRISPDGLVANVELVAVLAGAGS